ncbi:RNA polymerase sigma-70 factor (ECF subfamily) [Rhizobium aquaticum]|uniref:RNA polymerase sigma-70 factor (ECF subfamily) n=1 Tax=Rhizobium aquaticum TaxID=1549636 RepID=A0ABV2IUS5_9HYPH
MNGSDLDSCLADVATGDRAAFRQLYKLTASRLNGVLRPMISNRARREEILQEAFVKIWQNAARFDPQRGSAMMWMATVTRRLAIDELRRASPLIQSLDDDEALKNSLAADVPQLEPLGADQLEGCLKLLRSEYRDAVVLAYLKGLTYDQLALSLNRPLGTVKTWVHRGIIDLRECMG